MNLRIAQWREQPDCERIFDGDEYIASVGHSDMPAKTNASGDNGRAAHEVDLAECAQDIVIELRAHHFIGENDDLDDGYELNDDEAADYVLAALRELEAKDREALNKIAMVGQGWALDSVHAYQMRDLAAFREREKETAKRIKELETECATPILVATNRLADELADSRAQLAALREKVQGMEERTCYNCAGFDSPVDGCALDAPLAKGEKPSMQATFDNCEKWTRKGDPNV